MAKGARPDREGVDPRAAIARAAGAPDAVREIENLWIPLADGCRLAARAWIPADAERAPVPALLEYLPYRKRDGTRRRDEAMHRFFAARGYASLRVDLRGSGDSGGVLLDEYLEQEQLDALEVLRWIAAQPWCTGRVGMMGISWGGFNALQVAALQPPELGAVVTVCSTDDRYTDDAHYMGGCLLGENLLWGSVLFTLNAFPPDPEVVGPGWREQWIERLVHDRPFPAVWLEHQRRDAYWRHGSVGEDHGRIVCPVLVVGGWADGYTDAVPRLLAGLSVPRRGLVGPWAHLYPHEGVPGPAIGFLQEALRWWDRWLKGRDDGEGEEPLYRVWMQESAPPRSLVRPGRWVAEETWPSPRIGTRALRLAPGRLLEPDEPDVPEEPRDEPEPGAPPGARRHVLTSPQTTGLAGGSWCGFGQEGDMPGDQRPDDAGSLVFDSGPLAARCEILGAPRLRLVLVPDRPMALVAARLCELLPDGTSARVTFGVLNLAHRHGHAAPEPLVPGQPVEVELRLHDVAHAFPAGTRLRLALSSSYWPMVWPSPAPARLALSLGRCRLSLPVRPPRDADAWLRPLDPPLAAPAEVPVPLAPALDRRLVELDPATGETVVTHARDVDPCGEPALEHVAPIDLVHGHSLVETYRIHPDDPLSARAEVVQRATFERGGWSAAIATRTRLSATAREFVLEAELQAQEGGSEVFARRWRRRIPRDHL